MLENDIYREKLRHVGRLGKREAFGSVYTGRNVDGDSR